MGDARLVDAVRALAAAERGALRREAPLAIALCYPSPYRVGMSSLGFQAIYRLLHEQPGATCERAFLPDDVGAWRRARQPFVTVESLRPLSAFPVLAFSVAYELEVTGVLELIDGAGLRLLREERAPGDALVVAGGPLTFSNPAPLEPFVDVVVQGDAEDLVAPLVAAIAGARTKAEVLAALAPLPGFFVPGATPEAVRGQVTRARGPHLPARSVVLTPHTELSEMFLVEPERGCSRGCNYCVMRRTTNGGMRTFDADEVLALIPADARRVGLVGAAVTDHPRVVELVRAVVDGGREVGVSSLRADRLTRELVEALRDGGARHLTVASDGPSQRLRDAVDRRHTEAQLLAAAKLAKDAGLRRLKVYTVVGLPTETDADIDELARFTAELSAILPVALGVAPFAAKRNTPMDGAPFAGVDVVERRLARLRAGLKGRADVRPTSARWAWVEHMLAQCGPEAGLAAMDAWRAGGRFADWRRAFEARGCRPFEARRAADGRRAPFAWPSVGGA